MIVKAGGLTEQLIIFGDIFRYIATIEIQVHGLIRACTHTADTGRKGMADKAQFGEGGKGQKTDPIHEIQVCIFTLKNHIGTSVFDLSCIMHHS